MKSRIIIFLLSILFVIPSQAQIGISGRYVQSNYVEWNADLENEKLLPFAYETGIDYWFRLKKVRIEFLPELSYQEYQERSSKLESRWDQKALAFTFNTNIYPFDFLDDCQCPTWGKEGNFITNGLFVSINPGFSVSVIQNENYNSASSSNFRAINFFTSRLGVGAGLDIGLSNMLTLTPHVRYTFQGNLTHPSPEFVATSKARQVSAGIRLGMRFDKNNYGIR